MLPPSAERTTPKTMDRNLTLRDGRPLMFAPAVILALTSQNIAPARPVATRLKWRRILAAVTKARVACDGAKRSSPPRKGG